MNALRIKPSSSSVLRRNKGRTKTFKVGSLFSGIGGFCKAFEQAGAVPIWSNEKDSHARETFKLNFPDVRCEPMSVSDLSVVGDGLHPVDILTAGFPCQPFSGAGKRKGFQDERGLLFLDIIRLIEEFGSERPKILLLENVQNLESHNGGGSGYWKQGDTFTRIKNKIEEAGYWFNGTKFTQVLNTATHTEIPQNRSRVFMVAFNNEYFDYVDFNWPKPVDELRPIRDFLDNKQEQDAWYYYTEKRHPKYYPLFVEEFKKVGDESICLLRRNYVRSNKSGLCFTLMANMGEGGHNQPTIRDRWGIRKMTERECARLQGYEDAWFKIPEGVPRAHIYKQIGNSVTIPLVKKIAEECLRQLEISQSK